MKHLGDKKQQFKELFRPQMPKEWLQDYNTWLTTVDINNVLEQYNKRYSDFYYGGAVPIDFDLQEDNKCVVSELCNFNLQSMLNKKMKITFNNYSDTHISYTNSVTMTSARLLVSEIGVSHN